MCTSYVVVRGALYLEDASCSYSCRVVSRKVQHRHAHAPQHYSGQHAYLQ
jgi:hypothetical protein